MLRLSQAGDYAIRGVMHMVPSPQGTIFLVREVAEKCSIPRPFLAKIFQTLARSGVLRSHQGSGGGFSLARAADAIPLLEVVEAIEGKIVLHDCIYKIEQGLCETPAEETMGKVWKAAQEGMLKVLQETSIAAMVQSD